MHHSPPTEPHLRFPIKCPLCGEEALASFSVAHIASALLDTQSIRLHAPCHDITWIADPIEVEQIREYLGTGWLHGEPSRPV